MDDKQSIDNTTLVKLLNEYADLLEATGSNPYRVRAYRRAGRSITKWSRSISEMLAMEEDIKEIPGVGEGIAYTIQYIIQNNQIPAVKPSKKADKTPKKTKGRKFLRLYHLLPIANHFIKRLQSIPEITRVEWLGDYRRRRELVEDFQLVIETKAPQKVIQQLLQLNEVQTVMSQKEHHLTLLLTTGIQLNIHLTSQDHFGASLLFYTGSKAHHHALQALALEKNLVLNELGLFSHQATIAGEQEEEIYQQLGLSYIPPELRENTGEIAAARNKQLPSLITLEAIQGDLHCHTNETDGTEELETMVMAAFDRGYQYIAITDHSKRLAITNGLDEKRLLNQIKQIDALNAKQNKILILKSIEVDILADGSLDLSNDVLKELDIVVASVHSLFKLPEEKQTERIIRAMENPYFNILGHATGRLIKSRPPYAVNMARIIQAAKDNGCFLEINAQPYRLDINDIYAKAAKEKGVKVAISSDAHSIRELNFMQLGINQARRGWLTREDVINTRSWPDLKKMLKQNT